MVAVLAVLYHRGLGEDSASTLLNSPFCAVSGSRIPLRATRLETSQLPQVNRADYAKLRLHVRGVHVHHFVWGILCVFAAIGALYWNQVYPGAFLAALAASLITSEGKELILQRWGK